MFHILEAAPCALYDIWQSFERQCRERHPRFLDTLRSAGGLSPYCFKKSFQQEGGCEGPKDAVPAQATALSASKKRKRPSDAVGVDSVAEPEDRKRKQRKLSQAVADTDRRDGTSAKPSKSRKKAKKRRNAAMLDQVKVKDIGRANLTAAEEAATNTQRRMSVLPESVCVAFKAESA